MNPQDFRWPRLVPSDFLALALIVLAVVVGVITPLPIAVVPVFAMLGCAFGLLTFATRSTK
jgi:hypothetical protein